MSEWQECKLGEVISFNPTENLPKGTMAKKIAMEHLTPYNKKIQGYTLEAYKGGTKFKNGDTLVARITPCLENGKTAFVDILADNEVAFGSTEFIVLRQKDGVTDSKYISYLATSEDFRDIAIQLMTGTSGRQRVETSALKERLFSFPTLPTQRAIAEVLGRLDEKIDLLNRQNKTLEALAETYFRQWFVEEANDDWEEVPINSIVDVKDGTHDSPKQVEEGYYLVTSKHLGGNMIDFKSAYKISENDYNAINMRSKVDRFDILLSMIGTIGRLHLVINEDVNFAIKNVALYKTSKTPKFIYYIYLHLKSIKGKQYIDENSDGSTQEYVALGNLRSMTITVPDKVTLDKFNDLILPMFKKIEKNKDQINTLTNFINTLLPKLISGEVRVKM